MQTSLSNVHAEQLTVPQPVKKFLALYQPIAMLTTTAIGLCPEAHNISP
jgi:hypothetical protein